MDQIANRCGEESASDANVDPADRQAFLTLIAVGSDVPSAAEEAGIPLSAAQQLLHDSVALVEMAQLHNRLVHSLRAHGASLLSTSLEIVQKALGDGDWSDNARVALKLVISSGAMAAALGDSLSDLKQHVGARELKDRLRFLDRLEAAEMSENEWMQAMSPTVTSRQGQRTRRR